MAITQVQFIAGSTQTSATPTSLTLTLGAATTSGNFVIVALSARSSLLNRVTSSHGVFRLLNPSGTNTNTGRSGYIYYAKMFGADTAITITTVSGTNSPMAGVAVEYSGIGDVDNVAPSVNASNTSTATPTTGALTNVSTNALLVGSLMTQGFNSATENASWASSPSSPFSIVGQITSDVNSGSVDIAVAFLQAIVSTASSRTASASSSLGTLFCAGDLASFSQSVASGGGLRTAGHGGLAA